MNRPTSTDKLPLVDYATTRVSSGRVAQRTGRFFVWGLLAAYIGAHATDALPAVDKLRDGLFWLLLSNIIAIYAPEFLDRVVALFRK